MTHSQLLTRCLTASLLFAGCAAGLSAQAQTIQEYLYTPDTLYTINTGLGIATQIEIDPKEDIKDYGTGFTSGWDLVRRDNVIYVKPKNTDVDTNMYIRSATRSYMIELKVVAKDWRSLDEAKSTGVNYKVRFTYGDSADDSNSVSTNTPLNWSGTGFYTNYDYATTSGESWLMPTKVYDDGKFTYIALPENGDVTGTLPVVLGRKTENGKEFVLNTNVENNVIVVHGVYHYLVMRHGDNVVGLRRN